MKRFLISVCMLGLLAFQASADDFDRIIEIKLHSSEYLWAQGRTSVKDDAVKLATDQFLDVVNAWIYENSCLLAANRLLEASQIICTKKGGLYLALVYLAIEDIAKIEADPTPATETEAIEKAPKENEEEHRQDNLAGDALLKLILTTPKMDALKEVLLQDAQVKDICQWGEIDASTKPSDLNDAYLVIYNPTSQDIICVLSPRQPKRVNLFTGEQDSTSNYPGHKACWVNILD